MDTSNMSIVTTGDLEAQEHNSNGFADHKYMLCTNQEGEANELGFVILKVPKYFRQPIQAFSPQGWQFGLHNRENLDKSGSEAIKLSVALKYGLVGEKWDHFCDAIVDDTKSMLACYDLLGGVTNWSDEEIKHVLALDALFLADFFDTRLSKNERRLTTYYTSPSPFHGPNDVFYARYEAWVDIIQFDLCRVENQIPLILIGKVIEYISNFLAPHNLEGKEPLIVDLQYQQRSLRRGVNELTSCFMTTSSELFKIENSSFYGEKMHIFGVAYKTICGFKGLHVKQSEYENRPIHILSATKLEQSGIKIVGVDGPLYTMYYEKKYLYLPKMNIFDETISFIRNMAWYESKSISRGCLFTDYITLMMDLIQYREDLDFLIDCGVIDNACGTKAFGMWKAFDEGLLVLDSSQSHYDMKEAIMRRCGRRRYRLWSEFQITFCSKPWLILSTIAVVLVTMATLVQTYIAIIGSNKMKPIFP